MSVDSKTKINNFFFFFILCLPAIFVYLANMDSARVFLKDILTTPPVGDQHGIYQAFFEAAQGKIPEAILNGWMPVGYLALIGFYHWLSNLFFSSSLSESYVYHNIFYSLLSVFSSTLFVYFYTKRSLVGISKFKIAILTSTLWISLFFWGTLYKFDSFTWSHHTSTFIGFVFFISFLFYLEKESTFSIFSLFFFGTLFMFTRRHEFIALTAVFLFFTVIFLLNKKLSFKKLLSLKLLSISSIAIVSCILFVKIFSYGVPLNSHYSQQAKTNTYIMEYLKIRVDTLPTRVIQTFIDPNFYSYGNTFTEGLNVLEFEMANFSLPLIFQIPGIFLLFLFFIFYFICKFRKVFITNFYKNNDFLTLLLLVGFFCFLSLSCGYMSTSVWGGVHLKTGLVREFKLACLVFASTALVFIIQKFFSTTQPLTLKRKSLIVLAFLLLPYLFISVIWSNRQWITLKEFHLKPPKALYLCKNLNCDISFEPIKNISDKNLDIPFNYVLVNQVCGARDEGMHEHGTTFKDLNFVLRLRKCSSEMKIEIYPLITGYAGSGNPTLSFEVAKTLSF